MSTIKSDNSDLTINASGSGNDVIIQSNASTKVTVDGSVGDVKVESGDLFFATAGKGIVLGATSNTDANTLEDYEEGTFTPTINASSVSYNTQIGRYTKIGNRVFIDIYINISSISTTSSYSIILGLPFASSATYYPALTTKVNGFAWGGSATMLTFQVQPSATSIGAAGAYNNGGFNDVNANGLSAGDWIAVSGSYTV